MDTQQKTSGIIRQSRDDDTLCQQRFEDARRFEGLLTTLSRIFVNAPAGEIDQAIQQSLEQVVEYVNADRTSFFEFSDDLRQFHASHTYVVPGLPELPHAIMESARFPWCVARLQRGEVVQMFDMDDLPHEAETDKEQFRQLGIRSIVILPVVMGGTMLCALTVATLRERRHWSEQSVARLHLVAEMFANGLTRKHAWQEQDERFSIERLIADLSAEFINLPPDNVDASIDMGIKRIVEALPGVDRSTFAEFSPDHTQLCATHSFATSVYQPYPLGVVNIALPWCVENLRRGEIVSITRPEDFPEEAWIDLATFLRLGLKASMLIPLRVGGVVLFVLSVSSFRTGQICSDEVAQRFQVIGEIFANALIRKQHEESLRSTLVELKELRDRLQSENLYLQEEIQLRSSYGEIIGDSPVMQAVLRRVEQVAATNSTVLIQGETGTGKELIAQTIHRLSARKHRPMLTVNCAALPPTLIESALFGHEKGAFTGALRKKIGYFEVADDSTIFLDEIGELPLELQTKLLRVLEAGQFERIGSTQTITVNVRVIAATNQQLSKAVEQGTFREDLYYRLHIFPIHLPPLRERPQDIPLLVWAFVRHFAKRMNKPIERIPRTAMQALQQYSWPGNVRELRNVIEHALIISQGNALTLPLFDIEAPTVSFSSELSLDDVMKQHILAVLERTGWRVSGKQGAADILKVKATTLDAKMKKLGITRPA